VSPDVPADRPMGPVVDASPGAPGARPQTQGKTPARGRPREVIYRHTVLVRLTHWINALAIFLLVGTGLNIFNAHPQLYWGKFGADFDRPVLAIHPYPGPHGATRGELVVGPLHLDTTGVLGWSQQNGHWVGRAWPSWITVPSFTDLADARHWHFLLAWVLAVNGLAYLAWSLAIRHVQRDLWPTRADLRAIPRSILDHIRLRHPTGAEAKRYNVLQRLAYLGLILLVAGMVATGLTMSPGFNAVAPWMLDLFGGRQSARTLHFACATLIVLFIVVHLVEVVLAGPINEVRSMITGRYAVPAEHD
jgi:thiosulfate reductase cytochrome b subunit